MTSSNGALVRFVATNLFDYIFDTEELSVARAGSDDLDTNVRAVAEHIATTLGHSGKLVYAKAREALFYVQDPAKAAQVAEALEREFHRQLVMATGIAKWAEWTAGAELNACLIALEADIRREQLRRTTVVPPPQLDGTDPCEFDGLRPATTVLSRYPDGRPRVSAHTYDRYDRGRQQRTRILARLFKDDAPNDMGRWKQSFTDLEKLNDEAPASVRSKMCVTSVVR